MAFHISGKIGVSFGIVMLIIGVMIVGSAFETWRPLEDIETFMSEPDTEFVQEFIDEGEDGSAGWYLMIQGEYSLDNNGDGDVDACDGLNITVTDSQGNPPQRSKGDIYCELDDNRKMAGLDEENVDMNDGWMIVGIMCDTQDDAEMNGYWESTNAEDGSESEKWVQTAENAHCEIGEKYTISSDQEMILFDRHTQQELEEEGFWELICGLCCSCLALILVVVSSISGITMRPGTSALATMELSGASPVPVSGEGEGVTVPGTTPGAIFGAGPAAEPTTAPMPVPLTEESEDEPVESSVDALKKQFLAGAGKLAESEKTETEVEKE